MAAGLVLAVGAASGLVSELVLVPRTPLSGVVEHLGGALVAGLVLWPLVRGTDAGRVGRALASRPLRAVGALSLGVFLYHPVPLALVSLVAPLADVTPLGRLAVGYPVAVVGGLGLAWLSRILVERPARHLIAGGDAHARQRAASTTSSRQPRRPAGPADGVLVLLAAGTVVALAFREGGYAVTSSGPALAVLAVAAAITILLRGAPPLGASGWTVAVALGGYSAWTALSARWAPAVTPALEAALVPAAAVAALVLAGQLADPRSPRRLAAAVGATLALVALAGVLAQLVGLPQVTGASSLSGGRLAEPLGYWNATGLAAALGVVLTSGTLAGAQSPRIGAIALAAVVPAGAALGMTLSRGSLVAAALGVGLTVLLDGRRTTVRAATATFAFAGAATLLGLAVASLTDTTGSLARLGALAVLLLLAVGALPVGARLVRAATQRTARRDLRWGPGRVALALVVAVLAVGPTMAVLAAGTTQQPGFGTGAARLTTAGNDRLAYWRVALRSATQDPWRGTGAGGYAQAWRQQRSSGERVRNAHSQPLEALAELGIPGLTLLVVVGLAAGLTLLGWVRRSPEGAAPTAAAAAYGVHAAVDWDWQFLALTLVPALLVGAGAAARASRASQPSESRGSRRRRPANAASRPGPGGLASTTASRAS